MAVTRKRIRFSPVESAIIGLIALLLLANFWREHASAAQDAARYH
jgi:hypothetical protein